MPGGPQKRKNDTKERKRNNYCEDLRIAKILLKMPNFYLIAKI